MRLGFDASKGGGMLLGPYRATGCHQRRRERESGSGGERASGTAIVALAFAVSSLSSPLITHNSLSQKMSF